MRMCALSTRVSHTCWRHARWAALFAALVFCGASGMLGCQKSPFVADTPRTQFELHDRLHNRYVPLEEPDEFGTPQPALRARLGRPY